MLPAATFRSHLYFHIERVVQVQQMERDVAAAAAKLINSSALHSNRCVPFSVVFFCNHVFAQR